MVDFANVACPSCRRTFMVHHEFFRIDGAYCHCPFCATEFPPASISARYDKPGENRRPSLESAG
jgi:hypothetical protein